MMVSPCKRVKQEEDEDVVDLRLAESYSPLGLGVAKCMVILIVQSLSFNHRTSHAMCASLLLLDRICSPIKERIIDTNAIAWAVLSSFMASSSSATTTTHVMLIATWVVISSAHTLHGGIPLINSNPSISLLHGLRDTSSPLPIQEVIACIITSIMVTSSPSSAIFEELDSTSALRTIIYLFMSSMWSYTIVVMSVRKAPSGTGIAKATAVLTATRFMVVLYSPVTVIIPWASAISLWMLWICLRHSSMNNHPKKRNEVSFNQLGVHFTTTSDTHTHRTKSFFYHPIKKRWAYQKHLQ